MIVNSGVQWMRRSGGGNLLLNGFVSGSRRVTLIAVRFNMRRGHGGGKVMGKPVQSALMEGVENVWVFGLINIHLFHYLITDGEFLLEIFISLRTRWEVKGNRIRDGEGDGNREA